MSSKNGKTAESTARKINPFIERIFACPICSVQSPQRRFKTNLFAERGRDIDLRPLQYVTTAKGLDDYRPPLYYVWHCPDCHFASGYMFYEEPFKDCGLSANQLKQKVVSGRAAKANADAVIEKLSSDVQAPVLNFFQGFKLHLLAIYNLQIDDVVASNSSINLGRYYLRTAWLYHDLKEDRATKDEYKSKVSTVVKSLKSKWKDVPADEETALKKSVKCFCEALTGSYAIKTPLDQVEMSLLISRIYMKLGDIPQARRYLQTGKDGARKSVEKVNKQISGTGEEGPPLDDKKKTELRGMCRKLEMVVDHAQNVFEDVRSEWEDQQLEKANEVLAKNDDKSLDALRDLLRSSDIDDMIANKLIARRQKKTKKGLFGLFG